MRMWYDSQNVIRFRSIEACKIVVLYWRNYCHLAWRHVLTRFTDVSEKLPKQRVLRRVPYAVLSIVHVRGFERGALLSASQCIHTSWPTFRKIRLKLNFSQVGIQYKHCEVHSFTQGSLFEIQTPTHWYLKDHK